MKNKYQKIGRLTMLLTLLATGLRSQTPLSGSYSVPGSYASIAAAITDLNSNGVSGPVTIDVAAGYTETSPVGGYTLNAITGASGANTITFQKSGAGANPLVSAYAGGVGTPTSNIQDGVWRFVGTDYVTIDGIDIIDNNGANPATMEFGYGFFKASATDGCQNNTIKNCSITLNRINNAAGAFPALDGSRGIDVVNASPATHTTAVTITAASGANSNNKFYSNTIQNCNIGIAMTGFSASSPFSLADTGNDIGGASTSNGNSILNFGGGGTTSAAMGIHTHNQYNLNVSYNVINSNNGSGVNHAQVLKGIYTNTATSANTTINNNTVTVKGGGTTHAVTAIENAAGATAAGNAITINNNLVANCSYATSTSGAFTGIVNSASSASLSLSSNTLTGNSTSATSGSVYQVSNTGGVTSNITINNNSIATFSFTGAMSSSFYCINNTGGGSGAVLFMNNNNIQGINYGVAASNINYLIYNSAATLNQTINNNTFTSLVLNTTSDVVFIYNNVSLPANGLQIVSGNSIVTSFSKTGAGGTVTLFTTNASSVGGSLETHTNNNFSNITLTGATTMAGWSNTDGGSPSKNISNNVFSNWTCGTNGVTAMSVNYSGSNTFISSNLISNITGAAAITGISFGSSNAGTLSAISSNVITGLNSTTSGGAIVGITIAAGSVSLLNVNNNTIGSFSTVAGSAVTGISCASAQNNNIYSNKIYDLQSNNSGGSVNGITISAGNPTNVYNNIIGDLRTPLASAVNPLRGINITGGTAHNLYYNTVYINGSSSGTNFGSTAVQVSSTPVVTMRNNIFVNTSTAAGTGTTVAYRRSSTTLTSYGSTSNNNLFYAGTPGATNQIFNDGTNAVQTLAAYKTFVASRDAQAITENPTFVSTAGANANFLNINISVPTQIESAGQPVSGITGDYASNTRNASTPDIGAWEGNYVLNDITPPGVSSSGFTTPPCILTGRTFTAAISDISGVGSGALAPRLYYKINGGSYSSTPGTLTSGSVTNGVWTFTISYSVVVTDVVSHFLVAQDAALTPNLMASPNTGFAGTDVNNVTVPPTNASTYPINTLSGVYTVGAAGTFTSLTAAATAYNTYCLSGPVTFSLTDALYSTAETFPVAFKNNPQASSTNSLSIVPAAGVSVVITPTIASLSSIIKFLDAQYITMDGVNSGGSSISVNNSSGSAAVANIWLASSNNTLTAGNKYIVIKNLAINGISASSSNGVIAGIDGVLPTTTAGMDNDNITISGNTFLTSYNGILAAGSGSISAGGMDNWVIANNTFGPAVSATTNLGGSGLVVAGAVNLSVTANVIQNISTSSSGIYGMNLNNGINGYAVSQNTVMNLTSSASSSGTNAIAAVYSGVNAINGTINNNNFNSIVNSSTSGYGARGVMLNSFSAASNIQMRNNFISNIYCYVDVSAIYWPIGIAIEGNTGGITIDNNSISLYGSHPGYASASGATSSAPIYVTSSATGNITIRNNVLSNTYDNSTFATDIVYAIYSGATASNFTSMDYNDYYVGGTGNVQTLAYLSSGVANLQALQNAFGFGQNLHSLNFQPQFTSGTDLHLVTTAVSNAGLDNTGLSLPAVTIDIDNQARAITPDIGADEFTATGTCTSAVGGTLSTTAATMCTTQTVLATPNGVSTGVGTTYQWKSSATAGGPYTNITTGTGTSSPTYFSPLTPFAPGVYYVVLQASCASGPIANISNEATLTVVAPPSPSVVSTSSLVCQGNSATLTASGALTYAWSTGATTSSIAVTPAANTTYTLIGTNVCSVPVTFNLLYAVNPTVNVVSASPTVCSNVQATLTASGADTYSWSNGVTAAVITPTQSANTSYTVVGTNTTGCVSAPVIRNITVNPSPTVSIVGSSGICTGQNANLTVNGIGVVSYSWNTGSTATTIVDSPTSNTVYVVSGTGANGCVSTASQSVSVAASLSISISGTSTICVGQAANLVASGGVTYDWSTTETTTTITPSPLVNTTYTVIGSSGTCSNSAVLEVTVNPTPSVAIAGNALICPGIATTLTASGADTYSWNTSALTTSVVVSPTTATNYSVIGTTSLGCSSTASFAISTNTVPVIAIAQTATAVCVSSPATFTATGASSYTWGASGPFTNTLAVSPAVATVYTVTGSNAAGCITTKTVNLGIYALPVLTLTPVTATVCALSPVSFAAAGAATYTWNGTVVSANPSFTPAASGIYTVVAASANNCISSGTVGVVTNSLPVVSISPTSPTVCEQSSLTFTASGGSSYFWIANGQNGATNTVFPTSNTVYTVLVSNALGCSTTGTVAVTTKTLPVVSVTPSFTTVCSSVPTTFTATGAVTYTWNNNSAVTGSTAVLGTTVATSYVVSGTGANGCVADGQFIVLANPLPTVSIAASSSTVCSLAPVQFTATGASTYTWSNNNAVGDTIVVNPASSTVYTVLGQDAATGCIGSQTAVVVTNPLPVVTIAPASPTVCVKTPVTFTAAGSVSYAWVSSTGAVSSNTNVSITPTANVSYTVTGTDALGCKNTATVTLVTNALPVIVPTATQVTICKDETVELSATGAVNYSWTPLGTSIPGSPNSASVTVSPTVVTIYTVTGSDNNGCSNKATVLVLLNSCTGIKTNSLGSGLSIFPNPTTGVFTAKFEFEGQKMIMITNSVGQVVTGISTENTSENIDLSHYAKGVYFVIVKTKQGSANYKIILE